MKRPETADTPSRRVYFDRPPRCRRKVSLSGHSCIYHDALQLAESPIETSRRPVSQLKLSHIAYGPSASS